MSCAAVRTRAVALPSPLGTTVDFLHNRKGDERVHAFEVAFRGEMEEKVEDAIEDLRGDAARLGGTLKRSRLDEYYVARNLTPDDAALVEKALREVGVSFEEEPPTSATTFVSGVDALDALLRTARSIPFLGVEGELECGHAIRRYLEYVADGDRTSELARRLEERARLARERLVTSNVFTVAKIARDRKLHGRMPLEDMVQEGLIGLMTAAEKFDPTLGVRFSTYAHYWIRQAIARDIANSQSTIRIPVHRRQQMSAYRRARYLAGYRGAYRPSEIPIVAEKLGWTPDFAMRIAMLLEQRTTSLDTPVGEENTTVGELIPSGAPTPHDVIAELDMQRAVGELVETLESERHRDIIRRRFGLHGDTGSQTLEEIGQLYGITRERVRQIEAKALEKLKPRVRALRLRTLLEDG